MFLVFAVALLAISAVKAASLKDLEQQLEEEVFNRGAKAAETDDQSSEYVQFSLRFLVYRGHARIARDACMYISLKLFN